MKTYLSLAILLFCSPLPAFAGPQIGTLTQVSGSVQIFSHPSKDGTTGPAPHAKYEGIFYSVRSATVGETVDKGNILRTQPGAKAIVIFENGDQYYVAPATSFRVDWDQDTAQGKTQLELRYGKSRFVIGKQGPRSRLHIRTRTATLGVRGTDFFVAVNDSSGATETATLRGSVQVSAQAEAAAPSSPTIVSAGETASVAPSAEVAVHKTTQGELQAISRNSAAEPSSQPVSSEVAKKIESLQSTAAQATLQDIRVEDPTLAAKLESQSAAGVTDLNQAVIADRESEAPSDGDAVGPIADESLEKGGAPAPTQDSTQSPPSTPRTYWIGLKLGSITASIDIENIDDAPKDPLKTNTLGFSGEYVISHNFSLVAELYPYAVHGYHFPGLPFALPKVKAAGTDLFAGIKPGISFGQNQTVELYLVGGLRVSKIWSANATTALGQEIDVSEQTSSITKAIELGLGISVKGTERLKFSLDLRGFHGIGDFVQNGPLANSAGATLPQAPMQDSSGILGVAYGI